MYSPTPCGCRRGLESYSMGSAATDVGAPGTTSPGGADPGVSPDAGREFLEWLLGIVIASALVSRR